MSEPDMGTPGFERELRHIGKIPVSIEELVKKFGRNVVVVDGFNFYGGYLYPQFDWICCGFKEVVQEIRCFVEAFERIGVKLVFFFAEGNLDEGADSCGSDTWMERRSTFVKYTSEFYTRSQNYGSMKEKRKYYHTPVNALPVVLFTLRHILKCEVHLIYAGDRNDAVASYSRDNNCLAVLAQDKYYRYYSFIPRYLSLYNLKLLEMTTVQYCRETLAQHMNLRGHLYPIFIINSSITSEQKNTLFKIEEKLDECESTEIARKKILEYWSGKNIEEVLDLRGLDIENISQSLRDFLFNVLRYKLGFDYLTVYGPLEEWDLIKLQAQELYASGQMSRLIQNILRSKKYYNECILENFVQLPPSSEVYQLLRVKLYGILFHEEPERKVISDDVSNSNDSATSDTFQPGASSIWDRKLHRVDKKGKPYESKVVQEWYSSQKGRPRRVVVNIEPVNPTLHPGLLRLWNSNNLTFNITDQKWQLFASSISDHLQWQLLRQLPPTLVVPTVVLYYLFQVVPSKFQNGSWNFLKTWEVEVFIAQAVMLPKIDANSLSEINIVKINPRVVNLSAFFIHGCHQVRLLIQACGHPISEQDLSVFHFFDGKLFHNFYDRAEWRRNPKILCDQDASIRYEQMKRIIIPETGTKSMQI